MDIYYRDQIFEKFSEHQIDDALNNCYQDEKEEILEGYFSTCQGYFNFTEKISEFSIIHQENQCDCTDGVGASGADCPSHGDSKCTSCNTGFILENEACISEVIPIADCGQEFVNLIPRLFPKSCENFDPSKIIENLKGNFSSIPIESEHMKVWYFTSTEKMTWEEGYEFCKSAGLEYAQVHSDAEFYETIEQRVGRSVWIGGTRLNPMTQEFWTGDDNVVRSNYYWSNGQRICLDKWFDREPNNYRGKEYHMELQERTDVGITRWNDRFYPGTENVMCEYRCAKSVQIQCSCTDGIAASGFDCPIHGDSKCMSCNEGFFLNNDTCISEQFKTCSCHDGTPAMGVACPIHGSEFCISCDLGFVLSNPSMTCTAIHDIRTECGSQEFIDLIPTFYPNSCEGLETAEDISVPDIFKEKFSMFPVESAYMKVWYFTSTTKMSWDEGYELCKSSGLGYAEVHSEAEFNETVRHRGDGYQKSWMGGSTVEPITHEKWEEANENRKLDFRWTNGQPICLDKWLTVGSTPNDQPDNHVAYGFKQFITLRGPFYWNNNVGWDDKHGGTENVMCEYRCSK